MPTPDVARLALLILGTSAPMLALGVAHGQAADVPLVPASDAGAPADDAPASPMPLSPVPEQDAAPAPSPAPAATVLPSTRAETVEEPPPARTDQEALPSFGQRGQIAIFGGASIGISSSTFDGSSAGGVDYTFSPGFDYFVARNIAIGLTLDASYADGKGYGADGSLVETQTTTLSAGARFGLNVPLGGWLSWYPHATIGFEWNKKTEQLAAGSSLSIPGSALGYPQTTQLGPYINIYAPLLLHATDHFFFGFGPEFYHDFGSVSGGPNIGGQRTQILAGFVVGGYWGGEIPRSAAPVPSPPPSKRFGDAGEFVFTDDLGLSVSSLTYAGTDSTTRSVSVGGSFDYFVADHLSIGLGASVSSSYFKGIDAQSRAGVTSSRTTLSFGPRVGVNVPIGDTFSVFPEFVLGIGHQGYDETSGTSENQTSDDMVSIGFFVPLLVHPVRHLFAGLGPSLYHELSHSVTFPDPLAPTVQNRETTLGIGSVIGGWL